MFLTVGPQIVASSRTRVYQYLPFLKEDGIDYKVVTFNTGLAYHLNRFQPRSSIGRMAYRLIAGIIRGYDFLYSIFKTIWFLALSGHYDLMFIQKTLLPAAIITLLKEKKGKIVFDFDDAIYAEPDDYNKRRFDSQIPLYDLVVLENTYTREYIYEHGNRNALIITGPIDCKHYFPKYRTEKENKVVIGWIGSPSTEIYLRPLENVFKRLCVTHKNSIFELVGAGKTSIAGVNAVFKKWRLDNEVATLHGFDIGIMVLPDNEWTRGKGGYKLLQYMAVGIPCVASPVGVNKELVRDGENGFLATTGEEWYEKLSLLIENPELRKKMGVRGRDFVVKNYSFDVAAPKLISALKGLI